MPKREALNNSHLALLDVRLAWKCKWACRCQDCRTPSSSLQTVNQLGHSLREPKKVRDHENLKLQTKYVSPLQKSTQILSYSFKTFVKAYVGHEFLKQSSAYPGDPKGAQLSVKGIIPVSLA